MLKLKCPICENPVELPSSIKIKARVTCPNCFAQLGLFKHKNKLMLACGICKNQVFDPGECGDCERRRDRRKTILEEGRL